MDSNDTKLLTAIHEVKADVRELRTKIDDSVNGRFKDIERRVSSLEAVVKWFAILVIGGVLTAVLSLVLK